MCVQATSSEYSEESDLESLGGPGVSIGQSHGGATGGASRLKKKRDSQASYTSDMMESESDFRELEMNMDIIDEYYYGVRIFPGQDPSQASQIPPNPAFAVTSRAARAPRIFHWEQDRRAENRGRMPRTGAGVLRRDSNPSHLHQVGGSAEPRPPKGFPLF